MRTALLAIVLLSSTASAFAQLPDAPGKDTLVKVCGTCHQAERAASVRLTREGWEEVIGDMIKRGARGTDEEFKAALDYLATNFLGDAPRPLNINRATNIELESVAGLTRKEAAAVLAYRVVLFWIPLVMGIPAWFFLRRGLDDIAREELKAVEC